LRRRSNPAERGKQHDWKGIGAAGDEEGGGGQQYSDRHHDAGFDSVEQQADQRPAQSGGERQHAGQHRGARVGPSEMLDELWKEEAAGVVSAAEEQEQGDEQARDEHPSLPFREVM
jgi:hypothetical protein